MNLKELSLLNFRNYTSSSFSFEPNSIHILCGKNAQGKTNLIEAVYYLSHLRSFRTNQMNSLIQTDKDYFRMEAQIENHGQNQDLAVIVSQQKKHLFLYKNPVNRYSDFVGVLNAVLFCPDDLMLFHQSPKNRRHFIDMELIKLSHTYTKTLSHFQKILRYRNKLLKQEKIDDALLSIYTDQIIKDECIIMKQRSLFISQLMDRASQFYPFFSDKKEVIDARYCTFVSDFSFDALKQVYDSHLEKDKRYHQTNMGIHKDDVQFLLNGIPIAECASQGQKRSFLLALKLGLVQIIKEKTQQYPILLLDDVFSELDSNRKAQLIQHLPKDMQIFITTTEPVDAAWFTARSVHCYNVDQGQIQEVPL